jgi:hypothetical protein
MRRECGGCGPAAKAAGGPRVNARHSDMCATPTSGLVLTFDCVFGRPFVVPSVCVLPFALACTWVRASQTLGITRPCFECGCDAPFVKKKGHCSKQESAGGTHATWLQNAQAHPRADRGHASLHACTWRW